MYILRCVGAFFYSIIDFFSLLCVGLLFLLPQVNWNWWVVFIPVWLYYIGSIFGAILNYALGIYLTKDLGEENLSEVPTTNNKKRDRRSPLLFRSSL